MGWGDRNVPITSHVKLLLFLVLLHTLQHAPVADAHGLHQGRQVLQVKVPVRAPMRLPRPRRVLCQDLLAAERAVPAAASVGVAADVSVRVSHVVPVVLVELVVHDLAERLPPERETLLQVQPDALEEQGVLQAPKVFEMRIAAERPMQMRHAGGEVLREAVDVARRDLGTRGQLA